MKPGRAYISSLGTTGVLIASSVLLLVVVGALMAYDRWPAGASSGGADSIVIGTADGAVPASATAGDRRAARAKRRAAATRKRKTARVTRARAARKRGVQYGVGVSRVPGGAVISGHSVPESAGGGPNAGGDGARVPASGGGTRGAPGGVGAGERPSGVVPDTLSGINAGAGQAVDGLGQSVEGPADVPLESLSPGLAP